MIDHAGEDGVGVELPLRLADDEPDAPLRAEHLADQRADDREPERGVQAGDDPGHRRGDGDVARDLEWRRAEHPDVGDQVRVDLADALEGVEEDDEEDQNGGQQHLRERAQAEGDQEDGAEDDAGHRVDDLDVRAQDVGEEPVLPEQQPDRDARDGAEDEPVDRLLQGGPDVAPDGAEFGALGEQLDQ